MLVLAVLIVGLLPLTARAFPPAHGNAPGGQGPWSHGSKWNVPNFKSMVVFGDSYTDSSRYLYFTSHDGNAPPVGYSNPTNYDASDNGRIWASYVGQYSGANIYNYAVRGAVCSNNLTPRTAVSGNLSFPYPSVEQYEVPAFLADSTYTVGGKEFLDIPTEDTVYTIWIGTNDVGTGAYLSDSQKTGDLTSYVDCVYNQFSRIYQRGARKFILMNLAPLHLAPLYALPSVGNNGTYQNATETSYRMLETVKTVNAIFAYRTPFQAMISNDFPGSQWAVYNVHDLLTDIYNHPSLYLNGTAPLNVTGFIAQCTSSNPCAGQTSPDSYMWYNNLHPSEQTDRVIAKNFVEVVKGTSKWATYWA
ncbi:carbohydrate esterase family 16 protein [Zasmidium cellare ATCC 36951]|uniref:Carbohydrate esterase family 16 protein n=1 Tax=Zasmidium cellare ATCC 36951 TaxID=1080233 RepID=A0A6A6BWK7_ZASCE|nr:carbohydrate esterase family 16 protein [Zasmidium cellare ATCC 36951]KAF2159214.1 carbohydrate esterase family 16 protein [Zasmidium cellare ATCC 36951]